MGSESSRAPSTKLYAYGAYEPDVACVCWKVTQTKFGVFHGTLMGDVFFPLLMIGLYEFGTWRVGSAFEFFEAT